MVHKFGNFFSLAFSKNSSRILNQNHFWFEWDSVWKCVLGGRLNWPDFLPGSPSVDCRFGKLFTYRNGRHYAAREGLVTICIQCIHCLLTINLLNLDPFELLFDSFHPWTNQFDSVADHWLVIHTNSDQQCCSDIGPNASIMYGLESKFWSGHFPGKLSKRKR